MPIIFDNITFTGGILLSGASGTPAPLGDQYFQYTTLLLDGLGANNAQNNTFLNSSSVAKTITRNGNTTQGSFTTFSHSNGYWSNFFDGSGDYLSTPTNAAFNPESGDFCAEGWFYPTTATTSSIFSTYYGSSGVGVIVALVNDGKVRVRFGNDGSVSNYDGFDSVATYTLNTWNHVAFSKQGSTLRAWLNGTSIGTTTTARTATTTTAVIGRYYVDTNNFYFSGYISSVRFVKGSSVYNTAQTTITVPTTPLTAITNTSLLTCQSSRFRDNSTNNFAITVNGDTTTTLFQPFTLSTEYNSSTMGGSMYFDGNGDNLSIAADSSLNLVSGNFTIECWIYAFPMGSNGIILQKDHTSGTYSQYALELFTDGRIQAYTSQSDNGSTTGLRTIVSSAIPYRTWHHIAFTRNGGTFYLYINGVEAGSTAANNTMTDNGRPLTVGSYSSSNWFNGYIQDVRIVKGTAVYTANFTPPTAPLTNISGTSLLLSGTNAGIVDSTGFTNPETRADAKISTAQSKWGGSSMYFDGTGDFLWLPASRDYEYGTGKFTMEAWVYPTSSGSYRGIFTNWQTGGAFIFTLNNANVLEFSYNTSSGSGTYSGTTTVATNTWTHVAVVRDGAFITLYVNGVAESSPRNIGASASFAYTGKPIYIGTGGDTGGPMNGYIQGLRVTKGIARYTGNFTPPTDY